MAFAVDNRLKTRRSQDLGNCVTFSIFVILLMHDFGVNTLKKPLKCVYLKNTALKTAINFAENSAPSGMFHHIGFGILVGKLAN